MQNIEQILQELEIEVPESKKDDLKKKMLENYRTVADYNKQVSKADDYKKSLDSVQEQLAGFKDVDVDDLKGQIQTLNQQLADEKAGRAADARKIEVEKQVSEFLASTDEKGAKQYEFMNGITEEYYKKALMEELDKDSAKGKSISDIFNGMITDKDGNQKEGIFVDKQQTAAQHNAARFTAPAKNGNRGRTGLTKEDFRKMNLDERLKLKQSDPELYTALSE
nr:MAG TPA: minor structural protein [Caudoviricetes sp.]